MPKRYEAIRDALMQRGKSEKEAKRIAAATYQKTRRKGEPELNKAIERERKRK